MQSYTKFNLIHIVEGLKNNTKEFFEKIYTIQKTLINKGKLMTIDIDKKSLKKPNEPIIMKDLYDEPVKSLINDDHVGLTVAAQLFKKPDTYLNKQNIENIKSYPYFYINNTHNTYLAGMLLYNTEMTIIKDYVTLDLIEASMIIDKSDNLCTGIFNDFIDILKKENQYHGIASGVSHPKALAILKKLGFKQSEENKNVLIYKIR